MERNIYKIGKELFITSDEEIKEDAWIYDVENNSVNKLIFKHNETAFDKKIILTTNQDLIADGVQAIDDEFLEWFVKNPTCEQVEVQNDYEEPKGDYYKIILPQEEPKLIKCYCGHTIYCDCGPQEEKSYLTFTSNEENPVNIHMRVLPEFDSVSKQDLIEKSRNEEMPEDYFPPKDLANAIWGSCFQYEDMEKNNIEEKVKKACFTVEKIYKIQDYVGSK